MKRLTSRCFWPGTSTALRSCAGIPCQVQGKQVIVKLWQPGESRNSCSRTVASEADCGSLAALVVLAGLGSGVAYIGSRRKWGASDIGNELRLEVIEARDFRQVRKSSTSVTFAYIGSDPQWQGRSLQLRLDDGQALASDRAANLLLGQGFALEGELVALNSDVAIALLEGHSSSVASSSKKVVALKIARVAASEAQEGCTVTVEICPGHGVGDLYGIPSAFGMQEDSEMRRDELARAGKYSARDIYSGRPDRLRRALHALRDHPQDTLRVLVDGKCIFPASSSADAATVEQAMQTELGLEGGLGSLMEVVADCFDRQGKELLMALIRAQCSAGATTNAQARQLEQIYRQHAGPQAPQNGSLASPDALQAAFARGFWTLPPDDSGRAAREREGERLLERARRELWAEGSASRHELEAQVRTFVCRNLLGRAANTACVQLTMVRARPDSTSQLADLHFTPSLVQAGSGAQLWCRVNLVDFELPQEGRLRT